MAPPTVKESPDQNVTPPENPSPADNAKALEKLIADINLLLEIQASKAPSSSIVEKEDFVAPSTPIPPENSKAPISRQKSDSDLSSLVLESCQFDYLKSTQQELDFFESALISKHQESSEFPVEKYQEEGMFQCPLPQHQAPLVIQVKQTPEPKETIEETEQLKLRLKQMEETLRSMQGLDAPINLNLNELCLVQDVEFPPNFETSHFEKYSGFTCPKMHLTKYYRRMMAHARNEKLLMHIFQESLSGSAEHWYNSLKPTEIRSWQEMADAFMNYYSYNAYSAPTREDAKKLERKDAEGFREYAIRWRNFAVQVRPVLSEKEMSPLFIDTLRGVLLDKLLPSMKSSFSEILAMGEYIENLVNEKKILDPEEMMAAFEQMSQNTDWEREEEEINMTQAEMPSFPDPLNNQNPRYQMPSRPPRYQMPSHHPRYQMPFIPRYQTPQYQRPFIPPCYPIPRNQTPHYQRPSIPRYQTPQHQIPVRTPCYRTAAPPLFCQNPAPPYPDQNYQRPMNQCQAPRPQKVYTQWPIPINELYTTLIAEGKLLKKPARTWDPLPQWYNAFKNCDYHSNERGHSIFRCPALHDDIEKLVQQGLVTFEANEGTSTGDNQTGVFINMLYVNDVPILANQKVREELRMDLQKNDQLQCKSSQPEIDQKSMTKNSEGSSEADSSSVLGIEYPLIYEGSGKLKNWSTKSSC